MRVYFSATITENETLKSMYRLMLEYLKKNNHKVLDYGSDKLTPTMIISQDYDELKEKYRELDSYLKNSDVYIADISEPSVGIGYEISQAILLRKPVLALKYQKAPYHPLSTIKGNKNPYMRYKEYNERTIDTILKQFLDEAKDKIDTKFILIIPAEIDRYLEWNVRERGKPKAEITREAIEAMMLNDAKYQEYLKNNEYPDVELDSEGEK